MKQIYFLFITAFSLNFLMAQSCPPNAFSTGDTVYFIDDTNSINCFEVPSSITIEGSTYTGTGCSSNLVTYKLDLGGTQTGNTAVFDVDFGGGTICSYTNGTLPVDKYSFLNVNFKVYPNPLTSENIIKLSFGLPLTGKVGVYSITGKQVLKGFVNNQDSKDINVASLANGIYMLKVTTDNASITRKVVVLK